MPDDSPSKALRALADRVECHKRDCGCSTTWNGKCAAREAEATEARAIASDVAALEAHLAKVFTPGRWRHKGTGRIATAAWWDDEPGYVRFEWDDGTWDTWPLYDHTWGREWVPVRDD